MIVSILQMMGFGMGKAPAKNAREDSAEKSRAARAIAVSDKPQAAAGSKATPAKKAAKAAVKAVPKAASKSTASKASPVKSAATKVAPVKASAKVAAKAPAKDSVKAPVKVPAKAPVKAAPKAAAKVAVKAAPVKAAVKVVAKPPAKAPVKAATQVAAKAVVKAAPSPTKVVSKSSVPSVSSTAVKAAPAVPKTAKPTAAPVAAPSKPVTPAKTAVKAAAKPAPVAPAPAPVAVPPVKPVVTRAARGSRLAQLTVPSMAQAVASTAAKASYTQIMSTTSVAPPTHVVPKKDPKLANNWKTKPLAELTDAEILAMSDDDYMNDVQMAYFRLKLVKLKQDILNSAGETTEHLREDTVIVPDPADRATIEEEHALELRTRDRERKLLKKIEQSINRIDSGDYGYCDETGEPIGVGRLLARPTASLSLEAQQRRELKQKMFGD